MKALKTFLELFEADTKKCEKKKKKLNLILKQLSEMHGAVRVKK